jgi:hypothetical protein
MDHGNTIQHFGIYTLLRAFENHFIASTELRHRFINLQFKYSGATSITRQNSCYVGSFTVTSRRAKHLEKKLPIK